MRRASAGRALAASLVVGFAAVAACGPRPGPEKPPEPENTGRLTIHVKDMTKVLNLV